ncbi:ATP-dependent helicase [Nocardioides panacisoli]|uniref:ATP-dependent DNA helicase n=1 Tax=Nocardioides panacisoli TaxID=627624 RepID=UPI001C6271CE|nr:ATP-dependent DNA helicase [Nocardioides panacisoli]QYJ05736.1 ATP-dependent helicase [Nocardioides panacisoli]
MTRIDTPEALCRRMGLDYVFSDEQWAAISAPLEPAVVIAGAGSGKTTVMAARVVHLVLTGQVRPDEVLGLTFTTKAASELRHKILEALTTAGALDLLAPREVAEDGGADVLEPTVATYNAYAAGLLTDHGLRIGHEPDTRVITDAVRYQLGARTIDRHTEPIEFLTDHADTAIQNLLALESAISEHLVSEQQVRDFDAEQRRHFEAALVEETAGKNRKTYRDAVAAAIHAIDRRAELLGLVAAYRRLKATYGVMDFSDQIALAARLAQEQPEVGAAERGKFRVVLLDEYQDTSVAQAIMLSRLFSGDAADTGRGHAVTAVGDPNQAIYGWRGASVSNILDFATTFPAADGRERRDHLSISQRSDRRILEVANALAAPLYARYGDQVAPLRPAPGKAEGRVDVAVFETDREELAWLAEAVRAAHTGAWSDIGVLTRDNAHAEGVFDALTSAGIPVEIVGLSGLLRLAEVAHVVAVLSLLHDVTDNAALLTLLSGPRWAVGPRDLRLLGRRAREIAGRDGRVDSEAPDLATQVVELADGIDPAEIPCLDDALADPAPTEEHRAAYSAEALERFALLRDELRLLRSHVGEPLLDLVRRIIDTTGVDVELASSGAAAAEARRDNLDLFVKAVADFQAVDGEVSLVSLLAYLTAEDEQGNGMDVATPTEADSVKLLTVHRAKGLEWDTVFCVGVGETRFPATRGRTRWVTSPSVLPTPLRGDAADLPQLTGHDKPAIEDYKQRAKDHDQEEELRLGYVALTRAAHQLWVSSYLWGPTTRPFGPSPYQATVREQLDQWGEVPHQWLDKPDKGAPHPLAGDDPAVPWPVPHEGEEARRRRDAAARVRAAELDAPDPELDVVDASRVAQWDADIDRLLAEARRDRADEVVVPLPSSLSATALGRLQDDPTGFARDLARPMPRPPSPSARFGTRFHAWVEARFGQQGLFDPDELAGRADAGISDEQDLKELVASFEAGPFGDRTPYAVEAPFALVLAGQVVRGRIDAVYLEEAAPDEDGPRFLVVDWKTNRAATADPLQLAIYRQAWAELAGVDPGQVRAAFHYVRTGDLVVHHDLPDRQALVALLGA